MAVVQAAWRGVQPVRITLDASAPHMRVGARALRITMLHVPGCTLSRRVTTSAEYARFIPVARAPKSDVDLDVCVLREACG